MLSIKNWLKPCVGLVLFLASFCLWPQDLSAVTKEELLFIIDFQKNLIDDYEIQQEEDNSLHQQKDSLIIEYQSLTDDLTEENQTLLTSEQESSEQIKSMTTSIGRLEDSNRWLRNVGKISITIAIIEGVVIFLLAING